MTSEKKKFLVPVTWLVAAEVVVEAADEDEAMDLATGIDLENYKNQGYVNGSFDVDFGMIEEVSGDDS